MGRRRDFPRAPDLCQLHHRGGNSKREDYARRTRFHGKMTMEKSTGLSGRSCSKDDLAVPGQRRGTRMRGVAVHGAGMMRGGILLVLALALPSAGSPDSDRRLAINYVVAYAPQNCARLAKCCECKGGIAAGDLRIGLRHAPPLTPCFSPDRGCTLSLCMP